MEVAENFQHYYSKEMLFESLLGKAFHPAVQCFHSSKYFCFKKDSFFLSEKTDRVLLNKRQEKKCRKFSF